MMEIMQDEIFKESQNRHLMTVGFLSALSENLNYDKAFDIALKAFTNYMVNFWEINLKDTLKGSQERFDKFRKHYENICPSYCEIIESTGSILRVCYRRCPFSEVAKFHGVFELAYSFCLSDTAMTSIVLPGVAFQRNYEIIKGDPICDHTWIYNGEQI